MVTYYIFFGTKNHRNRLILHVLAQHQHGFLLVSYGIRSPCLKINRSPEDLLRSIPQGALYINFTFRASAKMVDYFIQINNMGMLSNISDITLKAAFLTL